MRIRFDDGDPVIWQTPKPSRIPVNCEYWILIANFINRSQSNKLYSGASYNDKSEYFYCKERNEYFPLSNPDLTKQVVGFVVSKGYFPINLNRN